jgi:hypothetical protein
MKIDHFHFGVSVRLKSVSNHISLCPWTTVLKVKVQVCGGTVRKSRIECAATGLEPIRCSRDLAATLVSDRPIKDPFSWRTPPEYLSRTFPFLFRTLTMFYDITSRTLCRKEKRKWKFTAQIFGGDPPWRGVLERVEASYCENRNFVTAVVHTWLWPEAAPQL